MINFKIKKLSFFYLSKFKELLSDVFYYENVNEHKYYLSILPLCIQKIVRYFMSVRYAKYWVALNHEGKILGIIGVYSLRTDQPEELWVSWFCVESESRKKAIGQSLLTHVINYAKIKSKKKLKIYTSNMPEEIQAQMLYEKNSFKIFQTILETNGYLKIYREKNLS